MSKGSSNCASRYPMNLRTVGSDGCGQQLAGDRIDMTYASLRTYETHGHNALGGEKLQSVTRKGSPDGLQVHKRKYYRLDQLQKLAAVRKQVVYCATQPFTERGFAGVRRCGWRASRRRSRALGSKA